MLVAIGRQRLSAPAFIHARKLGHTAAVFLPDPRSFDRGYFTAQTERENIMKANHRAAVVLEPAAQEFVTATAEPPYLFNLGPEAGRKTVNEVQSGKGVVKPDVDEGGSRSPGARRARSRLVSSRRAARGRTCR